jgi:hypothetical protein
MGRGQVVRRLILAQEIVGSNPTVPAIAIILEKESREALFVIITP